MAFAAFTTGGTFSGRGIGRGLVAASPAFPVLPVFIAVTVADEPCVSDDVEVETPAAGFPPWPFDGRFIELGNNCRRTGSEPV